jgi:phenylacetate-coenzyme A ligase PaaK-like adenylate-forming protein
MEDRTPDPQTLDPIERVSVDELRALQLRRLKSSLRHAFDKHQIGVMVAVDVVAPGGIERSVGKMRRIVDDRPRG